MRKIHSYEFKAGSDHPFPTLPELAHRYLDEQGLHCGRFLYYFEALDFDHYKVHPCQRLYNDLPAIGTPVKDAMEGQHPAHYITNMETDGGVSEEELLPLMNKIYRTYGLSTAVLYYGDVDFFGKAGLHAFSRDPNDKRPPLWRLYGSGLKLEKDIFGTSVRLSVDETVDGAYHDSKPYADALKALLGAKRAFEVIKTILTDEERARAERLNVECGPAANEARVFFAERIRGLKRPPSKDFPTCSVVPAVKKEAKKRGYVYANRSNGWFETTKKTPNGNELVFTFDHPQFLEVRIGLTFHAPGVRKALFFTTADPEKQQDYDEFVAYLFELADEYERTLLRHLDDFFPATPAWYGHEWSDPYSDAELQAFENARNGK